MPSLGGTELLIILAVLVLLFGATKLPNAARAIGQSMRIFKAETKGMRSDEEPAHQPPPPPSLPPSGHVGTGGQDTRVEEPHRRNDTLR